MIVGLCAFANWAAWGYPRTIQRFASAFVSAVMEGGRHPGGR